jgi:hypothetical protein
MNKIPITVCLYTSTKGHFGRTDCYQRTVRRLFSIFPPVDWDALLANIKVGDENNQNQDRDIAMWLTECGFSVEGYPGIWSHGNDSHQNEYLADMKRMMNRVRTPYFLHLEDDMLIHVYQKQFDYWLSEAVDFLETDPNLMQVRIPRYNNEAERILALKAKHGIDGKAEWSKGEEFFYHNDWSNNPFVARTRDFRAALQIVSKTNLPKHTEHGVGFAMKMLSNVELPFACFNPENLRVCHIGTKPEDEDNPTKPLFAT